MGTCKVREAENDIGTTINHTYTLLYTGRLDGFKDKSGEWVIDKASVERYRRLRELRAELQSNVRSAK